MQSKPLDIEELEEIAKIHAKFQPKMGIKRLLRNAGRCSTSITMVLQNPGTKVTHSS